MKNLFFTLFLFSMFTAHAQHQLTGIVKDASGGAPVPYATAAVLNPDSTAVTGAMTGEDGKFAIAGVAAGNYIVQVSFIGYEKAYRRVNVPAQSDLGEISLAESATRLKEVVVNATRPLIENRADRYVVNVSGNIQSAGRDALDVLRYTPGVLVDMKGSISSMGKGMAVWIDGRPSRLSGDQLQTLLSTLKGDDIDRIEVITNPSSRYDASGSGGIIDIRTKKGLQHGLNGTVNGNVQQSHVNRAAVGASLNWRNSKANVFGNYSIGRYNRWWKAEQIRNMGNTVMSSESLEKATSPTIRQQYRLGADFFLNSKNTVGILYNGYNNTGQKEKSSGTTDITYPLGDVSRALSENLVERAASGHQVNVNWQSNFAEGQQLNVDADYARFGAHGEQSTKNEYFGADGAIIGELEQMRNTNPNTVDMYSIKADYSRPAWKDAKLEAGAKASYSTTDNDLTFEEYTGGGWQTDADQTNRFVYSEDIYAAYFNLSQQLGKVSLQVGLRGEYTQWNSDQRTTNQANDTAYFNLFPTFFVNWQASKTHNLGLSYSRRIARPSYQALNPFERRMDAYSYTVGNPSLTPYYTHNVQLSWSLGQKLMARLAYSHATDQITETQINMGDGCYALTNINFGTTRNLTLMVMYRATVTKFWNITLMAGGGYMSSEDGREYSNNTLYTQTQLQNSLTITKTLSAEVTGMYVAGAEEGYFEIEPFGNVNVALRQQLMKGKVSVGLTVNDVFNTYIMKGSAKYDQTDYHLRSYQDIRSANLTFRYNFGSSTVKAARSRRVGIEDEAGRARTN